MGEEGREGGRAGGREGRRDGGWNRRSSSVPSSRHASKEKACGGGLFSLVSLTALEKEGGRGRWRGGGRGVL